MKKYFYDLLSTLKSIAEWFADNTKKQNEILLKLSDKLVTLSDGVLSVNWSYAWEHGITSLKNNFVEDSRDEWVMIDRSKAIKIITINGKAEKNETFTRLSSLTKEEKEHYKKYGIVLIIKNETR